MVEHSAITGTVSEQHWIQLLNTYLPGRYRATSAFILNSQHKRSRQIDLAIYDHLQSPIFLPTSSAVHLPIESIYAVFEVKTLFSLEFFRDAGTRVESVRKLTKRKILGGLLATSSVWKPDGFSTNLKRTLKGLPEIQEMDIGCSMEHGAFNSKPKLTVSSPEEALLFFILHLGDRLNRLPPRPPVSMLDYYRAA
jgi:hypothetical protein